MADRAAEAVAELVATLGVGLVATAPETVEKYRFDRAREAGAGTPLAVVRAERAADVQETMRWASRHGIPVVTRGAGSGLAGGANAVDGAVTLSLERMTGIEIDVASRVAVVEAGALNIDVKTAAAAHGLWYPPDPSSYDICSIGGNVATNAGGLCCVKYGVTSEYVLGLDVVLADGTAITLGGKRIKDVAGLSLVKLVVGSEGTLGVVTQAVLRLVPLPAPRSTLVATFATVREAADAVIETGRHVRAAMLELMDRAAINAVEDYRALGLDREAGAMLIAQSDAPAAARADEVEAIRQACVLSGAKDVFATDDPDEGEQFVQARRLALPACEARGAVLIEDVGAPVPMLPMLLAQCEEIAARHEIEIPVVAHAGDGNTHPTIIFDPADPDARRRALAAFDDLLRAAISVGGTVTGEHGVGRAKAHVLPEQLGDDVMALTRRVKAAFDPQGLLNPGTLLRPHQLRRADKARSHTPDQGPAPLQ